MTTCHWTGSSLYDNLSLDKRLQVHYSGLRSAIHTVTERVFALSPVMASAQANRFTMLSSGREHFEQYRVALEFRSVLAALSSCGLAVFDNCFNRQELISLAKSLGSVHLHRDSDEQGVTVLEPKKGPNETGFTTKALFPHTDSSGTVCPPDVLIFCCEQRAPWGGESLFVDGQRLVSALRTADNRLLTFLSRPDAAMFSSTAGYIPMPMICQLDLNRCAIRFRLDSSVLFSEQLLGKLPALIDLVRKCTFPIHLQNGEGFIMNNGWWLHGRTAFHGYRRVTRILVDVADTALCRGFTL